MIVALAFAALIVPVVAEYIFDRADKRGGGSSAEPAHPTVLNGQIVPAPAPAPAEPVSDEYTFTDVRDAEQCATESRLARELLDGTLDRTRYQEEMAALAAGAASPQGRPGGRSG